MLQAGVKESVELIPVGYSFASRLLLSEEEIISGAHLVGDSNPIHLVPGSEHPLNFEELIASGSHVTGLFSALIPTEFSKFGPMIGVQVAVKFLRPILANVEYSMEWVVNSYAWKAGLNGYLYNLSGQIVKVDAESAPSSLVVRADADIVYYGPSGSTQFPSR
jgi:acyl dehydratase